MENNVVVQVPAPTPNRNQGPSTAVVAIVSLIAFVLVAAALWVWHAVPVSAQDLKDASWLYGHGDVVHFSSLFAMLGAAMAIMGIGISVAKKQYLLGVESLLVGVLTAASGVPTLNFIAAADGGTAKVGCFVWETKECHTMLGLAGGEALPSMYVPRAQADRTGDVYTPAYDRQAEALHSSAEPFMPALSSIAMAPMIAFHTDALNARLNAQRAEVASRRAADAAASKH